MAFANKFAQLKRNVRECLEPNVRGVEMDVKIQAARDVADALTTLHVANNDSASRIATAVNSLTNAIQSTHVQVAKNSTELAARLNRLTLWVLAAVVLSAGAAAIQAVGVIYQMAHPAEPHQVIVIPKP